MSGRQVFAVWIPLLVTCVIASSAHLAFADPGSPLQNPLPEDPLRVQMPESGAHGGRFVVSELSAPKTFNVVMAIDAPTMEVAGQLFAALIRFDHATQQFSPGLAKSWETSPDGLTWTLHLRRGARFSDGHPITSADVLFSFEVCYDPKLHPSIQDLLMVGGKRFEVTAPDAQTVVIRLPERYAMILSAIGAINVLPKHTLEASFLEGRFGSAYNTATNPDSLVTSGPFRVKRYRPNEIVVLSPNPYWYGVDAKGQRLPYLDELVFLIIPDRNTASLQFETGSLDALDQVLGQDFKRYADDQQKGNYTVHDLGPMLAAQYMVFNLNRVRAPKVGSKVGDPYASPEKYAWFSNPDFRRAVSHAIDREAMIRSAFFGEAVKNWSTATAADKIWYTRDIVGPDYDPAESRRLFANLGFSDRDGDGFLEDTQGNPVSFVLKATANNPVFMQECTFIQDDLSKVGIRCTPSTVDFGTLVGNLRDNFQFDAAILGLQGGVPPDPATSQTFYKSSGAMHAWNILQPHAETASEAAIDSLMAENLSTNDMTTRLRTWSEIQKIVNRECFVIWLPTPVWKVPIRNGFGNVEPTALPPRIVWNADRVFVKRPTESRPARQTAGSRPKGKP